MTIVFTKLCNAFLPNAEVNREVLPGSAVDAVEGYRRKYGGIWVGGKVHVRADGIQFVPNGMNAALHSNIGALLVPFDCVRSVEWEFGVLTGIVALRCEGFDFRFRCFGAKNVVKRLASLVHPEPIAREDAHSG